MNTLRRTDTIQKSKHFTQKEVENLSGFTRGQLLKWEESCIVVPYRQPAILYTWNQLVFLRVLYHFRKDWTFKALEAMLCTLFNPKELKHLIEILPGSISVLLVLEEDDLLLQILKDIKLEQDISNHKLKKAVEKIRNGEKLDDEMALAIIKYITNDVSESDGLVVSVKKKTLIVIPEVIRELHKFAEELQIQNFDLKVS